MTIFFEPEQKKQRVFFSKNFSFPPHLHHEVEIIYCFAGTITVIYENKKCRLQQGEIGVFFSNVIHGYTDETCGKSVISIFNLRRVPEFSQIFTQMIPKEFIFKAGDQLKNFHMIFDYFLIEASASQLLDNAYTHLLLALIIEQLDLKPRTVQPNEPLLSQIIQYVSARYTEPLTLKEIAGAVNCSEYTVSRVFSEKLGISFRNYLNQLRGDHACRLLRETEVPIIDVALEAGFTSLRSFNRFFAGFYHQTPSTYRKNWHEIKG